MNFFAVLFALLFEQLKPLPHGNRVHDSVISWVRWTGRNFDAGRAHHATVVWCITVLGPALLTWGLHFAAGYFSFFLALTFDVLMLYFTLGFRQFSHYYTDIRDALERADEIEARRLLAEWRDRKSTRLNSSHQ